MKPILFNTEMVQAILEGRKTVTRRVIKPQPYIMNAGWSNILQIGNKGPLFPGCDNPKSSDVRWRFCNYMPGDIIYVRETWYYEEHMHDLTEGEPDLPSGKYLHRYVYKADNEDYPVNVGVGKHGWKPSIHMPKEAARIFLKVTDVRVERLKDTTEEQAIKEGITNTSKGFKEWVAGWSRSAYIMSFSELWNSTIKKQDLDEYGWDSNPWVWVIEFERVEVENEN